MNAHRSHRRSQRSPRVELELLEPRQLLSGTLLTPHPLGGMTPPTSALLAPSTVPPLVLAGTTVHAQVNQPFHAVVGMIRLESLPSVYTLQGTINWGDGTPTSDAAFVRQPNGAIMVLGGHTYTAPDNDPITVLLLAVPPAGTAVAIRKIGVIHSAAIVFDPNGGVTLNQTAGMPFTATLGIFRSNLSLTQMTAIINWGDGTTSIGKILALPTADPVAGGMFAVTGDHTYAIPGSFLVHIAIISPSPTPVASTTAITLVTSFESVIDVLPVLPTAV